MTGPFEVRYTAAAREDVLRLFDFLLERAQTLEDFDAAQAAIDALRNAVQNHLSRTPFIYRKAGDSAFVRELIIPFGNAGYVALFGIEGADTVNILAVRHQREDDYH
ncbi:MAG: plasmid stabilization protein [Curvibacter sp. RIFCSPHIGHO2_12_FULL_63_18]|uniref:type II toxin-antitoxin system RelE/ParE family toxin n=1 Tax=Rhodoferax sp. TaxID=50421 RepID=UPI0008B2E514|nr:type II toxin-antitoxin system RelE/ParE family toxin [Rhodoferax sp.]OGO96755.1 MAG: plasmid stabilization protein [Curvibacter sp. GWA2_63_95]OGP00933.1 MAG: plasmid stabilization protein [Curvibacter sp. RIFCSPHIGHO2_12_FULL_63_18]HCX80500.1 type II toxin-antitoxin system RelE/ParE family toxin [Rhodoferax sp.]